MIFCTYWFSVFALFFFPLYWLIRDSRLRIYLILAASVVFHSHFAGAAGVIPIVVLATLTWTLALAASTIRGDTADALEMDAPSAAVSQNADARHIAIFRIHLAGYICVFGMLAVVGALCYYKYSFFLVGDLLSIFNEPLAEHFKAGLKRNLPETAPLAISFFAFEFVHYLFEVRRGRVPLRSPLQFALFAVYFPSLVAGPIKRVQNFIPSLERGVRVVTSLHIASGLARLAAGLFKKLVVADNLTQYINAREPFYAGMETGERWLFLFALALRIYFDFSGYTDMALGLSTMLGVRLPRNFDTPYKSGSIREFWQRWHMTLSFWIRDYVYIPLGGSKYGVARRALNGLAAFALCGLWHGAALNFLLWGLYHGTLLALNNYYREAALLRPLAGLFDRYPLSARVLTFLSVSFGWLLFFYPVDRAWQMFTLLFAPGGLGGAT